MPLYDFICHVCNQEFETLVMGNETPKCPKCQSTDLRKQMSRFAVRSADSGTAPSSGSSSQCSGCPGGSCSTCH